MRVDGRQVAVSGRLLQPLTRRTNDILRLALATLFLAAVIASSLITRRDWVALERSVSGIVDVLTPTQSSLVYLLYGLAILALPFAIFIGLILAKQWKMLGAYAAAGLLAVISLSVSGNGISAPRWHFDLSDRLRTTLSQFLDQLPQPVFCCEPGLFWPEQLGGCDKECCQLSLRHRHKIGATRVGMF